MLVKNTDGDHSRTESTHRVVKRQYSIAMVVPSRVNRNQRFRRLEVSSGSNLRTDGRLGILLAFKDSLLTQIHENLPLAGHGIGIVEHLSGIEDTVFKVRVLAKKVVVSNPKGNRIVGTIEIVITAGAAIRLFESAVESFNHLFERAKCFRDNIVIGKTDDWCDLKVKRILFSKGELLGGQRISAVAIGNKTEVFREYPNPFKSHPHSKATGTHPTVIGNLITKDRFGDSIHDEPDIALDPFDFDVGFVGNEGLRALVIKIIDKRLDDDGSRFAVVGDHGMRNLDIVKVFKGLGSFAKGQAKIDMKGQAKRHDMRILFAKPKRRGILGQ